MEMKEYAVTGVRWQMGEGLTMEQRTQEAEDFIRTLEVGTPLILAAEPDNPQDNNAIAVYMHYTRRVGYITRESCKEIKPLLDRDGHCDVVVSGNDGHVTFFVKIPNAPEVNALPLETTRELPVCPLPQGLGLPFSKDEHALQVVAPQLVKLAVSADTIGQFLEMAKFYIPLSKLSLCREDDSWRDKVLKQLQKACRLKLPQSEKEQLEQLRDQLRVTMGDLHSSQKNWQQQLFERQLESLRQQAEGENGLFAKYEKYRKNQSGLIESLVRWFGEMSHVELRNYKDHEVFARRLSYCRVSRQELYEVFAAILLIEKYGVEKTGDGIRLPKELDTPKARKYFAKAIELQYMEATENGRFRWIGTGNKANTSELAYFLGKVYNYQYTFDGNAGENFPEESLNALFGVKRLYSLLTQVYNAQKPQRWRSMIDAMFE